MNRTEKKALYRVLMFVIPVFMALYYLRNLGKINMIFVLPDEYGYWMTAATFAGYDWSGLSGLSLYYSYGYSIILMPLFWIFKDSVLMYKAAICLNALLYIGAYFISCACGFRLADAMSLNFGITSTDKKNDVTAVIYRRKLVVVIICGVIALYCNNVVQVNIAWSEALLYFMFWLSFYTLLRYCESKNIFVLAAFGVEVVYMYIIHQRMLGVLIAAGMTVAGMAIKSIVYHVNFRRQSLQGDETGKDCKTTYIKKIASVVIVISIVVIFAIVFFAVKKSLTASLWSSQPEDRISVNNFSGQVGKIAALLSLDGIINLFCHVCGKFFYLFVASGSVIFWAFVGAIGIILKVILCTKSHRISVQNNEAYKKTCRMMPAYIYMLLSLLGLMGINCIFMNGQGGRIDNVVYGRYIEPVAGVLLLFGVLYMMKKRPRWQTYVVYMLVLMSIGIAADVLMVQNSSFASFMSTGVSLFYKGKPVDAFIVYGAIVTGIILSFFGYVAMRYKKAALWIMFAVVMLGYWGVCGYSVLDKGILVTHQYINQMQKVDNYIDKVETMTGMDNIPIYYTVSDEEEEYNYIYRIFHLQFLRKNDTINYISQNQANNSELMPDNYILIQYHIDGIDMEKYTIVAQWYGMVIMVPKDSDLEKFCDSYNSSEYYEIEGIMSGSATRSRSDAELFDSDYEQGFVVYAQDLCLSPGTYQVDMDVYVEFDDEKDALLYAGGKKKSEKTYPLTVGYADASYDYGEGVFFTNLLTVNSDDELEQNKGIYHITSQLVCDEAQSGVEIRFYAQGCAYIRVDSIKYRLLQQ